MREYASGLPLLPGRLVEDEEGTIWREEKNKVGQGGILETFLQPGHKRTVEEEEGDGTGGEGAKNVWEDEIAPSFYFDKEENENGGEIAKRAWNSYFTGGFGKRGFGQTTNKWEKLVARIPPTVFVRPMRSLLPGAVSLFDTAWQMSLCHSVTQIDLT